MLSLESKEELTPFRLAGTDESLRVTRPQAVILSMTENTVHLNYV